MIDRLLSALQRVRAQGDSSWMALCPCHQEKTPSLHVDELPDGTVLAHCFGCGANGQQVAEALGISLSDLLNGSLKEPPEGPRIEKLYFAQRDGAIAELGGEPRLLFTLFAVAAESAYVERPELFGNITDIDAHKAKLVELESRRAGLYERVARGWDTSDIVLGPIASDFAALVSWRRAPGCPVGKADICARLIEHLLAQETEARAA